MSVSCTSSLYNLSACFAVSDPQIIQPNVQTSGMNANFYYRLHYELFNSSIY